MKYYVQMIIATGSYTTELDQPEEIEKEEFKRRCIDYTLEMRKSYIRKLHNVRNGYCIE